MILPVSDARLVFRPVDHRQDAAAQGLDVDLAQLRRTARAKPPWFLTESCRSPTPTSLAPLDSRCHLSRGRPIRDRPATGPPQSVGLRVPGRLRACAREVSPTGAPGDRRGDPEVRGPAAGRRRRDDPRLRPPAADGLGASAAHRRVPASARFRCRRRRTAGAVPRGRGVAARADRLAAGAGARLAPRRARARAGRLGVAPRDRRCSRQGSDAADGTHGRAPVGTDTRAS